MSIVFSYGWMFVVVVKAPRDQNITKCDHNKNENVFIAKDVMNKCWWESKDFDYDDTILEGWLYNIK